MFCALCVAHAIGKLKRASGGPTTSFGARTVFFFFRGRQNLAIRANELRSWRIPTKTGGAFQHTRSAENRIEIVAITSRFLEQLWQCPRLCGAMSRTVSNDPIVKGHVPQHGKQSRWPMAHNHTGESITWAIYRP